MRKSRKSATIAVALYMSMFGSGTAFAQDTCTTPSICQVSCGNDFFCQMMQYIYKCDRQVCSG
jgi:hypothetical protein